MRGVTGHASRAGDRIQATRQQAWKNTGEKEKEGRVSRSGEKDQKEGLEISLGKKNSRAGYGRMIGEKHWKEGSSVEKRL